MPDARACSLGHSGLKKIIDENHLTSGQSWCIVDCVEYNGDNERAIAMAMTRSEIVKRSQLKLYAEGRCVRCGNKRESESRFCNACKIKKKEYIKRYKENWVKDGRCRYCGKKRDLYAISCNECQEKNRKRQRKYQERKAKASGGPAKEIRDKNYLTIAQT